jgi:hypothetical protein
MGFADEHLTDKEIEKVGTGYYNEFQDRELKKHIDICKECMEKVKDRVEF